MTTDTLSRTFKLHTIKDILTFPSPQWRIDQLLPVGGFTMLWAPMGQGKTFFALDLALSIASGQEFHRRKVKQGPVIYVLGEGRGGLKKRVTAWLEERGLDDVPHAFFVLEAVQFHSPGDVGALREQIDTLGVQPEMLVIDTFARSAVGVQENDATDVGKWIDAIRTLQDDLQVDVLAVHHSTKPKDGVAASERGSSAFIDAVDTAIELRRLALVVKVLCKKQKDAEHFEPFSLRMKVVPVGDGDDGGPMTSCVLVASDDLSRPDDVEAAHLDMLAALAALPSRTAPRKQWQQQTGLPERTFDRHRDRLLTLGYIEEGGKRGVYRLTEKGVLATANESPVSGHGEAA